MTFLQRCKAIQIKVSLLWIPYVFLLPFLPVAKIIFYIFLMLSIHELAHVLCALCFGYAIEKITIYPFGLAAGISDIGLGNLQKETIVIAAGPLMHVWFPFLFRFFYHMDWISNEFCSYLIMINASIMMFNLLPIYPLDGGRLLQGFFHCFLRFAAAQKATFGCSIIVMVVVLYMHLLSGFSGFLVLFFLLVQIFMACKEREYTKMRFLHYRYQHGCKYPLIMNEKEDLYRGRYNVVRLKKGWLSEENWLKLIFKGRG